ncbi:MAG TPA: FtsW/RodA/SpoVE family cell cycle protein [Anaerolineales bacterium]|nr:FtsW/RodA/SpoVE family cell cycle protein [Anaerolineales bacterium]HMV96031.1 FtsW/RodA/SpoVE family cell cycle protein [Anaerolineales bacterium]HMX74468.1 FtsW/RodA/SpoVE family cell cycle protein [Anaerolineales bacterium]HMZ42930.1 FtsW/RodA/SpoVE family cell cycle protein [Anaerolineales bacterium]HNA54381.1 FtsW/RodA/SpoVE family cell cycle protein [Anaerolineales bacterium]
MNREFSWRNFDFILLGAIVLASSFGTAMIRSAVAGNEVLQPLIIRQVYFAILGVVLIFLVGSIDYRYWLALYRPIYFGMIAFLVTLTGFGQSAFGAQRWFQVGVLFLQPTEFAKIVAIIVLGRYFEVAQHQPRDLKWAFGAIAWAAGIIIMILLQPNLSNVLLLSVILAVMLWMNGVQVKHVFSAAAIGAAAALSLIVLSVLGISIPGLQPYQQERIVNFVVPDPNDTYGNRYNVQQALIAVGAGGLFGEGYGHGTQTQLRFLKVRHTDFIFAASSEEFGMVGGALIIITLGIIVWRCIRAAQKSRDVAGATIAIGVATLIFFQAAVNIGMNLNLLPVSGLPLPFISYGGSGLTALMLGIGLVESVVMRHKQMEF